MNTIPSLRCLIVGDDALSILCAEYLLKQGHGIHSFISQSASTRHWAEQKKIPWFLDANSFLKSSEREQSFDYLFSIVHFKILPRQLLALPLKLAINYHDALLPKYAGLHATSWALLNGEIAHGISWHLMTEKIDAGDLLIQDHIPIESNETAFTLNLKCHHQALDSFKKLIHSLERNQFTLQRQELSQRSYFGRYLKPARAGIINWQSSSDNIDSLCRALYFGKNQTNTLGTAKFRIDNKLYIVAKHELITKSGENPGVISEINDQFIQIATQSQDVRLLSIKDIEGAFVSIADVIHNHHLKKGRQLIDDDKTVIEAAEKYCVHIAPREEFWVTQIRELRPLNIPFLNFSPKETVNNSCKTHSLRVLPDLLEELIKSHSNYAERDPIILSAFLAYFYRLNNYETFSVAFSYPDLNNSNHLMNLVANWVPFTIDLDPENEFQAILATVSKQYEKIIQNKSFQNDVFFRYPDLVKQDLPIAIIFSNIEHYPTIKGSVIDLVFNTVTNQINIYFSERYATVINQLINHLDTFLSSLCKERNAKIKYHSLLTLEEQKKLAITWNQTECIDLKSKTLNSEFEKQVLRTPNKIAIIFEGETLTYSELNQRVNHLAYYIQEWLGERGSHIAIYLPRCVDSVICMLAILKSGNTYVPIAAEAPLAKVRAIIADCEAKIIFTNAYLEDQLGDILAGTKIKISKLDSEWGTIETKNIKNLVNHYSSEQIAYVLYTSGSTGEPKGVQITQRALINFLLAISHEIDFHEEEVLLAITPFTFDISGLEIYLPLISGACCILAGYNTRIDPQKIALSILKYKVTIMQATPATWQMLMKIKWKNERHIKMLCGGEALNAQLAAQLLETNAPLWNLYGPTETTIWSTAYQVKPLIEELVIPIGKPIANTFVYVLDKQLQLVPVGIPGILHIGGAGVAQGYLNKPSLTNKYFIPNPFSDDNKKLYNTGDQVKWLTNGNLVYLERVDNQIKIRGFRIELGEIETCLRSYAGILQAVALNKTINESNNQIVAYLIVSEKTKFEREDLLVYLKTKLFDYMLPSHIVLLDELPINANGKVDKKALLELPLIDENKRLSSEPLTPCQLQLVDIWSEILGVSTQNIGIDDNFFALGGNSLLAVQVINRINSLCLVNLNIGTLFISSTIRELAKLIAKSSKFMFDLKSFPKANSEPQPLLDNQMRVWFLNNLSGNTAVYNIAVAWELKGELDYNILNKALTQIIKRQGMLRTLFSSSHRKPTQQLQPPESIKHTLAPEKLPDLSTQELNDYLKKLAAEPFLIEKEYLFRFRLFEITKDIHIFFVCLHHLIADGWSFDILYRELSSLYKSYYEKTNSLLSPLPIQYIDYCVWQRAISSNSFYEKQIEYWEKKLEKLSPLELPTDYPRPLIQSYEGSSVHFNISAEETLILRNLAKKHDSTLFTVMLSAFAFLLAKYTHQTDIAIGIPIANRRMEFVENIIGFFINTLVIRLDLSQNYRGIDLLKDTLKTVIEAQENSDVFFEKLIALLHPDRDQSHNPIFQVMFAFNNAINTEIDLPNIITRPIAIESNFAHMELICFIEEKNDRIEGYIEYNKLLFAKDSITRLVDNYLHVLKELTSKIEDSLDALSFLSHSERKILLTDWSSLKTQYPKNKNLIQLFEEQVKKNPSKTALIYQDEQISYQELNQRANQLAYSIQKTGVGTKGYIAIYFSRSIETIIAFLAIMKSGNAYIPIDEEAPLFLIQSLIDEAKVSAILTKKPFFESIQTIIAREILVILVDEQLNLIQKEAVINLPHQPTMDLAYVLYNSGSTGKPKGVQITHHSLVNLMFAMRDEIAFTEADIVLGITPFTFDLSVPDIYLPLTMGASLVLADTSTRFDANRIIQQIRNYNVTVMQATPTTWKMLVQENWSNQSRVKIICGGEGLKTQLAEQLCASSASVWNFYGPTETTVWATCYKIEVVDKQRSVISIGRPLANIEVFVLNQEEQLVPIGVPGELYIGGEAVGTGYLNNPDLTDKQFVSGNFLSEGRKKLYKTGDLAVWSHTGELHYIGRKDNQIKIRGYRIDAESIETILNKHPAIFESVILDRGPSNEHELVAYLVLKDESLLLSNIQDYLFLYLPIYMVPTKFIAIKQFPVTSNGKINRNVLPQLIDFRYLVDPVSYSTLSENNDEKIIIRILKKLIGLESIDPETNFFNLGLHSLLLVEFSTLLNESLNCKINVIDLFTYSTVRKLACFLMSSGHQKISINVTPRADARRKKTIRRQGRYES